MKSIGSSSSIIFWSIATEVGEPVDWAMATT